MSLWKSQDYFSTQLLLTDTSKGNYFQQYNFEILNYTSLNFARPGTPTDSHTAAMTAERRKLFEQLPRVNTDVNDNKCFPQGPQKRFMKKSIANLPENEIENKNDKNANVTQIGACVKFASDVTAVPNNESNESNEPNDLNEFNESNKTKEDDVNSRKKKNRDLKSYRRASAPAQGIDFYFKNIKQAKENLGKRQKNLPTIHAEEPEDDDHHHNHHNNHHHNNHHHNNHRNHHDHNANSVSIASAVSPCDPPSLSPCSSTSSLSSTVDMLSPENTNKQPFIPQDCYWIKSKNKNIPTGHSYDKNESHSYPDNMVGSLYENVPWSPAVSFLSGLASSTVRKSLPDDEGQQVGDFIIGKVIGCGGFSTVKQAHTMDNYSGSVETAAVKIVKNVPERDDNDRIQALLEREVAIWRGLNHPNIVQMLSVEEIDYATFVFSEYCPGGTLLDYIKKHGGKGLDEDEARNIFLEIAEALRYLHNDVRLVHKDFKLDNILLDKDDTWKVCDFGLTEFQNSANGYNNILLNSVGGSLAYCAPEQLRSPTPLKDPSVDIWSLGVVLFALVTGQLPFCDSFEPRLQFKILNGRYDESLLDDARVSDDLKDLLKGMFKTKPDQRLTISQIIEHRWCER
uniref:Serine/threonine-protein kinase ppk25 n=1 Tax=Anthurium amnicola TaxID=1678845 RepID=A0A1D1Y1S5_9ARAE